MNFDLFAATLDQVGHFPSDRNDDRQFLLQSRSCDVIEEAKDGLADVALERPRRKSVAVAFELRHFANQLGLDPSETQAGTRKVDTASEGRHVPGGSFGKMLTLVTAFEAAVKEQPILGLQGLAAGSDRLKNRFRTQLIDNRSS